MDYFAVGILGRDHDGSVLFVAPKYLKVMPLKKEGPVHLESNRTVLDLRCLISIE